MCGIAGIVGRKDGEETSRLEAALSSVQHRGPECSRLWNSKNNDALLGHCRLSIIDLDNRSRQPFLHTERYAITYNGELYNYLEIKQALIQKGHTFHTTSDTEVVVAAYAAWGADCLQRFDGAFAFAIWDEEEALLFAARDRFGEKPFFFSYENERVLFASEIKALWKLGVAKEVNAAMLYNFLTLGYVVNPRDGQETFYEGIYKLPAASFLTFKKGGEAVIESYWKPSIDVDSNITESAAIEQFSELFSASISRRLRSDVPIGTSLSGGLDSSAVVAFCQQQDAGRYSHQSFTAVFPGFEKNEQQHAALVAERFGLKPHYISIEDDEITGLMQTVMLHQEEPIGSASALAQYKVYEAAKRAGITVLLDGQGADEVLAGYTKYYSWYWRELYARKALGKSGELAAAKALGVKEAFGWSDKLGALLPHFAASIQQTRKEKAAANHPALNRDFAFANKRHSYYSLPHPLTLNGALHYNTTTNGLKELLRIADRNSMAHAVEVRLPFLSHELVEFLFALPPRMKIQGGWTKWLLRKATEKVLPAEIVWRKDKTGFEPPQKAWMQCQDVQDAIQEAKKAMVDRNILNAAILQKKAQPHTAYAADSLEWRIWSASFLF
jgi:asparagine synthase (glutamine-hydrolysing)